MRYLTGCGEGRLTDVDDQKVSATAPRYVNTVPRPSFLSTSSPASSIMSASRFLAVTAFGLLCSAQRPFSTSQLIRDPGVSGPPLELVHLYYDSFPTGIAVSASGRLFSNYPGAHDKNDTEAPGNGRYTIAELVSNTTESPYPSAAINSPPGGAINYTTYPPSGAGYSNYFIGSQSIVIDALDRAWVLDTGNFASVFLTLLVVFADR